jgi:hypothetical protein
MKKMGQIENLKERLVKYRISDNSMSRKYEEIIAINYKRVVVGNLQELFNFSENEAAVFFELQYLKHNQNNFSTKFNLLFKFMYRFILVQIKHPLFGLRVYASMVKMILRICLK